MAPLRIEAALVKPAARGAEVHRTGMGPRRSQAAARALALTPGDALLLLGFCGGLDEQATSGEVIVAEAVRTEDAWTGGVGREAARGKERVVCADAAGLAAMLERQGLTVRRGVIVCVPRIVVGEHRTRLLRGGALAADMESVWLAAGAAGRPFSAVRVVLDSPSHELLDPRAIPGALRAVRALRAVAFTLTQWRPPQRRAGETTNV